VDGRLVGEPADLARDDGEAAAELPGLFRLDGGVEGQEVCLVGNLVDGGDHVGNLVGPVVDDRELGGNRRCRLDQFPHRRFHLGQVGAAGFGHADRFIEGRVDAVHCLGQIVRRRRYLAAGGRHFRCGGRLLGHRRFQFARRGGDFRGGGGDLDAGAVHLADERIQIARHGFEGAEQFARFVARRDDPRRFRPRQLLAGLLQVAGGDFLGRSVVSSSGWVRRRARKSASKSDSRMISAPARRISGKET
jgi:hypothetical protein